jgi:hypothetical protein
VEPLIQLSRNVTPFRHVFPAGGTRLFFPHIEETPMPTYQSKTVTARPAKQGDKGFDASKGPQSVITLPDGTEKTVPTAEVTED